MTVHGQEIRVGSPLEILAAWEEVDLMRIALARAGRPGMAWTGLMLSMSDAGQLSAVNPLGLKSSDMHTFGIVSELKTNFEILNKLTHSIRMGGIVDPYANPIYGGLGGGIEGQAVLITAAMIALSVVFMAACCGSSPTHPFNFNDTGKEIMQATSLAFRLLHGTPTDDQPDHHAGGWAGHQDPALRNCCLYHHEHGIRDQPAARPAFRHRGGSGPFHWLGSPLQRSSLARSRFLGSWTG